MSLRASMAVVVAALIFVVFSSPGFAAGYNSTGLDETHDVYGPVSKGQSAASGADAHESLGVNSWSEGSATGLAGAGFEIDSKMTFDCRRMNKRLGDRTGMRWLSVDNCSASGITLRHCDAVGMTGTGCGGGDNADNWSDPVTISSGSERQVDGIAVAVSCGSGDVGEQCIVLVNHSGQIKHDVDNLESDGEEAAQKSADSGGLGSIVTDTAQDSDYLGERRTVGAKLSGCATGSYERVMADGDAIDCNGDKRSHLDFDGMDCGNRCTETETTLQETDESCIATVPSSKEVTSTEYGRHTCYIETNPDGSTYNSCEPADTSASCDDTTETCDVEVDLHAKICHYWREPITPGLICPKGSVLDQDTLTCVGALQCGTPESSTPPENTWYYPGSGGNCEKRNTTCEVKSITHRISGGVASDCKRHGWTYVSDYKEPVMECGKSGDEQCYGQSGGKSFPLYDTGVICQEYKNTPVHVIAGNDSCTAHGWELQGIYKYREPGHFTGGRGHAWVPGPVVTYRVCNDKGAGSCSTSISRKKACPTGQVVQDGKCVREPDKAGDTGRLDDGFDPTETNPYQDDKPINCPEGYSYPGTGDDCTKTYEVCAPRATQLAYCDYPGVQQGDDCVDSGTGTVSAPLCESGYHYTGDFQCTADDQSCHDETATTPACPSGYVANNGVCSPVTSGMIPRSDVEQFERMLAAAGEPSGNPFGLADDNGPLRLIQAAGGGTPDTRTCTFTGTSCPEGMNCNDWTQYDYYCGMEPSWNNSCKGESLADYDYEGKTNVVKDMYDDVSSYDQVYTKQELVKNEACFAQTNPFCSFVKTECLDAGPHEVDGLPVPRDCFHYVETYECEQGGNVPQCTYDPVPDDCTLSYSECDEENDDGSCRITTEHYVCESTGTSHDTDSDIHDEKGCGEYREECTKYDQHGTCVEKVKIKTCYDGQPNRCYDDDACTLTGTTCVEHDEDTGLCTKQQQDYHCEREMKTCVKSEALCHQEEGDAFGDGFDKVVGAESIVNAIMQDASSGDGDINAIRIMSGEPMKCNDDVIGEPIAKKCCNEKADDDGWFAECNEEEQALAAANRNDRAHKVGRYCSHHLNLGFTKICTVHTETYCVFNSMLAKLVNEQGRKQLDKLSKAPAGSQTRTSLDFAYMADAGQSGWHTTTVDGRTIAAYTWDTRCLDAETHGRNREVTCPAKPAFFVAACEGADCKVGDIPLPYHSSDTDWTLHELDAENGSRGITLNKNVQAGGQCQADDDADGGYSTCTLKLTSWPSGDSRSARFTVDISWAPFRSEGVTSDWSTNVRQSGRFKIWPSQVERTDGANLPDTIPVKIAVDNGSYRTFDVPTTIPAGGMTLPTSPETTIYGECDGNTNWCDMKVEALVSVNGKPWCKGDCPKKPALQCKGFTISEFMALDLSEMDLHEYTDSITPDVPSDDVLQSITQEKVDNARDEYESGSKQHANRSSSTVMRISPTDGRAPWKTTATLAQQIETDDGTIRVDSIDIDWGDGQIVTGIDPAGVGDKREVSHTYKQETDRDLEVVATFHLEDGTTARARAKLRSWTKNPPRQVGSYGGGTVDVGGYWQYDDTLSNHSGNEAPPGHYDQ